MTDALLAPYSQRTYTPPSTTDRLLRLSMDFTRGSHEFVCPTGYKSEAEFSELVILQTASTGSKIPAASSNSAATDRGRVRRRTLGLFGLKGAGGAATSRTASSDQTQGFEARIWRKSL